MWLLYAFASAIFAGLTSILAKLGIHQTDSDVATTIRTVIVLLFSWLMVWIVGSFPQLSSITLQSWLFLILSGLCTGFSWIFYFRALQIGNINKVVPIDKLSIAITVLLSFILLKEPVSINKILGVLLVTIGILLMINKTENTTIETNKSWLLYAILSAVFASLTTIFAKIGIATIDSTLATAIRTIVVLIMSLIILRIKHKKINSMNKKELFFICLSGLATGISWLCYYKALKEGITSVVVVVDKLSILVTIAFSYIVFKEKLENKSLVGLLLLVIGILSMIKK